MSILNSKLDLGGDPNVTAKELHGRHITNQQLSLPGTRKPTPKEMIDIRLQQMSPGLSFDDLHAYLTSNKAFVFVVENEKPLMLEDDISLFPSDMLILSLKLFFDNSSK